MQFYSVASFAHTRCAFVAGGVLAVLSLPAIAADLTPDTSRDLSDPTFLPLTHHFVGRSSYSSWKSAGGVDDYFGDQRYSFHQHIQEISQSFAFGVTNDLTLFGGASSIKYDTDYASGGGTGSTYVHRSRADLGLTYRVLDEKDRPLNFDVSADLSGRFSAALSHRTEYFTILGRAGVYRVGDGRYFDTIKGMKITSDGTWRYFAAVQTQTRLTSSVSIDLGWTYISANADHAHESASGTLFTLRSPAALGPELGLNYHLIPNKLVMRLGYSVQWIGRRRDQYADSTLDTATPHRHANSIGLSLSYSLF